MFSVIIPTRDRPSDFSVALGSVLDQRGAEFEVVVVNDGSGPEQAAAYAGLAVLADPRVRMLNLARRPNGHGQAYALNEGVRDAKTPYIAFLDDDDCWTDSGYLERVSRSIAGMGQGKVDLHLSNQAAYMGSEQRPGPIWIEELTKIAQQDRTPEGRFGAYAVTVDQLLRCRGFCHVNTLIVRRELYSAVGGMDEGIRWECDHDLYLRLIDHAESILYDPSIVARHNVPDPAKAASMTTSVSLLERRLFQLRVMDKAALFAKHPGIRAHGRRRKGHALKIIAEELAANGRAKEAAWYAGQALAALPTMKWAGYTAWLGRKMLLGRR
jgi:glycosyltransferase involved in cell wall biosynthesis